MSLVHRRQASPIIASLLFVVVLAELFAVFWGPIAFVRKPSLVLSPIYAPGFSEDEILRIRNMLERELASGSAHAIYPRSLIENFYLERDNTVGVFDGSYRGKKEAFELANRLGVERVAVAGVVQYESGITVNLTLYDIATDQVVGRTSLDFDNLAELEYAENGRGDSSHGILESLGLRSPGLGSAGVLFLGWLAVLLALAVALFFGVSIPFIAVEMLLGSGILLSLFSWIYALNGDMDYVQRFVATSGALNLEDTRSERIAALVRYSPPGLVLLHIWLTKVLRAGRRLRPTYGLVLMDEAGLFTVAASALLFTLSMPNFLVLRGLPLLAWIATAPLYLVLVRVPLKRKLAFALFFIGLQALMVNWWQGTFSYISLPFTVALTLIQSLPFVLLLAFTMYQTKYWWFSAALLWTAFDWFRSLGFLGYPWGLLGMSQYGQPAMIQIASLTGVWGIDFLPHLVSATLAWGLDRTFLSSTRRSLLPGIKIRFRQWIPLGASSILVLLTLFGGMLSLSIRENRYGGEADSGLRGPAVESAALSPESATRHLKLLLVQQNTDPRKHDYQLSFDVLSQLTERAISEEGDFDLVAWPESGFVPDVRFWLKDENAKRPRGRLVRSFLDWQRDRKIPLLTGTQDHVYVHSSSAEDEKLIMNSAMYLPADRISDSQRSYYYKIRLVPFTENFPYGERFPRVAQLLHNFSTTQWTAGKEYTVFDTGTFRFSTPICFEDVFPNHLRHFVLAGAEILVNISNDYWANTPLEGYQHAAHAVFRAVENRRPLVRATCSGWTISVDSSGRIAPEYPEFYSQGYLSANINLTDETEKLTLYTRWGDWFPISCGILWMIFMVYWRFFNK